MKHTTQLWFSWFIGGLLLCAFGFYNGYPLLYADTDMYIECGFTGDQAVYGRSMAYSFFVRHMSLASSLWWVIIGQGLLLSSVMLLSLKHYLPMERRRIALLHLLLITMLLLCTGISVRSSQVMPDIFTAIGGLGLILLMVAPSLSRLEKTYLSVISIWSVMSHTANLGSFLLLLVVVVLIMGIGWLRTRKWWLAPKQGLLGAALIGASWLGLSTIHYYTGGEFKISGASPIFFTSQLNEMGLVPLFLHEECESDTTWFLCPYRNEIPKSFLWHGNSPLYRMGGWQEADKEAYRKLNEAILSKPRYMTLFVQAAVMGTFRQFFNFDTDNIMLGIDWERSHYRKRFSWEYFRLTDSRQALGTLDLSTTNRRQRAIVYLSLFGLLALLFRPEWLRAIPMPLRRALLLIGLLLVCNAAVCGGLSNAAMRYQNRLIWAIPFFMSLVILSRWSAIRSKLVQIIQNS